MKVTALNEEEQPLADILERFGEGIAPKIIKAQLLYGYDLLDHLIKTDQKELIMDAINGTLDVFKIQYPPI